MSGPPRLIKCSVCRDWVPDDNFCIMCGHKLRQIARQLWYKLSSS